MFRNNVRVILLIKGEVMRKVKVMLIGMFLCMNLINKGIEE